MSHNLLSKPEVKSIFSSIKGFKTFDKDINFDYRFSLLDGFLETSKFLTTFAKSQGKISNSKVSTKHSSKKDEELFTNNAELDPR